MECFEHRGNPQHALLDQVNDSIDEPANTTGSGKQWAAIRVFSRFLRPIVLGNAQISPVVIHPHWDG
jgi:hypothetical protein